MASPRRSKRLRLLAEQRPVFAINESEESDNDTNDRDKVIQNNVPGPSNVSITSVIPLGPTNDQSNIAQKPKVRRKRKTALSNLVDNNEVSKQIADLVRDEVKKALGNMSSTMNVQPLAELSNANQAHQASGFQSIRIIDANENNEITNVTQNSNGTLSNTAGLPSATATLSQPNVTHATFPHMHANIQPVPSLAERPVEQLSTMTRIPAVPEAQTGQLSTTALGNQGAMEHAVRSMLGNTGTSNFNVVNTAKFDLPLGVALPEKLKNKIVSGEYIDLYLLVNPSMNEDTELNTGLDSQHPSSKINNQRSKLIQNIQSWTTAMHVYAAIYLPAHLNEVAALLQYIEFIRKMSKYGGFGWRDYDEVFRRSRQYDQINWDTPLINQYIAAISNTPNSRFNFRSNQGPSQGFRNQQQNFRPNSKSSAAFSGKIPNGFCIGYHKYGECRSSNCKYSHRCFTCKGQHSQSRCNVGDKK